MADFLLSFVSVIICCKLSEYFTFALRAEGYIGLYFIPLSWLSFFAIGMSVVTGGDFIRWMQTFLLEEYIFLAAIFLIFSSLLIFKIEQSVKKFWFW